MRSSSPEYLLLNKQKLVDITAPLNRERLGAITWTLFHTIAATFPPQPSEEDLQHAQNLIKAIGALYPCKQCAAHFREFIANHEPRIKSKRELIVWCELQIPKVLRASLISFMFEVLTVFVDCFCSDLRLVCEAHNNVNRFLNHTIVPCQNDAFMSEFNPSFYLSIN